MWVERPRNLVFISKEKSTHMHSFFKDQAHTWFKNMGFLSGFCFIFQSFRFGDNLNFMTLKLSKEIAKKSQDLISKVSVMRF